MDGDFHLVPLRLPDQVAAEAFEAFMLEEIFPAIPKEAGRSGRLTGLRLMRGDNSGESGNLTEYLWVISGLVNGNPATQQLERIRAFGVEAPATGLRAGDYHEVGRWSADAS